MGKTLPGSVAAEKRSNRPAIALGETARQRFGRGGGQEKEEEKRTLGRRARMKIHLSVIGES